MKWMIIGGTKNLGKYIFDNVDGYNYSRSNGYDITKEDTIKTLGVESLEYDVVFLNSFDGPPDDTNSTNGQLRTLLEIHKNWKDNNKEGYIFVMGSIAANYMTTLDPSFETYRISKAGLSYASKMCSMDFRNNLCKHRTTLIEPDRLDTEKSRNRKSWTGNGVSCYDILNFMNFAVSLQANTCIEEISFMLNYQYGE